MEAKIKELKELIEAHELSLKDSTISADAGLVAEINADIERAKKEIETLQAQTTKAVEVAEVKVEEAKKEGDKAEIKEAEKALTEAKVEVKEVEKVADKLEKVEVKAEKAEKKAHGGAGRGQGRKKSDIPKMPKEKGKRGGVRKGAGRKPKKASSPTKIVKPKGYKPRKDTPVFVKRKVVKKAKKAVSKKIVKKDEKVKSVRAFGQKIEYKNNSEFCSKLISAFKKRKAVSKKYGKKRTRPVFGVITSHIKDAVTRAIDNTPKKTIEANPKAFLAKATRLEKSAIRFLEDFKAILGSDFKKSEISSEFGDLEKSIKKLVSKYKK
ncbi:MAG: hypothetical protein IPJ01_11710 [Micavibrio sp.]|nr:hypothetical protein [Micavibrio sp.]